MPFFSDAHTLCIIYIRGILYEKYETNTRADNI
jgi:hypothetical protein